MRTSFQLRVGFVLGLAFMVAGCSTPTIQEPLPLLEPQPFAQLDGVVEPFTASVDAAITHRLERDGKLGGFLTSDILDLTLLEGEDVRVTGRWIADKMRPVLNVHEVELETTPSGLPEPLVRLYSNEHFAFTYPSEWRYWGEQGEQLYFYAKDDPLQKVIMTFTVRRAELSDELNATYGDFRVREDITQNGDRTQRTVVVPSQQFASWEYVFLFSSNDETPTTLGLFRAVLTSFAEGDTAQQRSKVFWAETAEPLFERLKERRAQEALQAEVAEAIGNDTDEAIEADAENDDEANTQVDNENESAMTDINESGTPSVDGGDDESFTDLIDARAHSYTSPLGYSARFPLASWYQHFGARGQALSFIGIRTDAPLEGAASATVSLELLAATDADLLRVPTPDEPVKYAQSPDGSFFEVTRWYAPERVFRLRGPYAQKDLMWSVARSIE